MALVYNTLYRDISGMHSVGYFFSFSVFRSFVVIIFHLKIDILESSEIRMYQIRFVR